MRGYKQHWHLVPASQGFNASSGTSGIWNVQHDQVELRSRVRRGFSKDDELVSGFRQPALRQLLHERVAVDDRNAKASEQDLNLCVCMTIGDTA